MTDYTKLSAKFPNVAYVVNWNIEAESLNIIYANNTKLQRRHLKLAPPPS